MASSCLSCSRLLPGRGKVGPAASTLRHPADTGAHTQLLTPTPQGSVHLQELSVEGDEDAACERPRCSGRPPLLLWALRHHRADGAQKRHWGVGEGTLDRSPSQALGSDRALNLNPCCPGTSPRYTGATLVFVQNASRWER